MKKPSVLDYLGQEVCHIVSPVSICMAITVFLVRVLNPDGASSSTVYVATAFYHEHEGDSTGTKIAGSLINAAVFVALVTAMTCVLVLLFKYGYTRFIYGYMAFAGFSVFFSLTGILAALLLQKAHAHLDVASFLFILYNFAVVGVLSLFYWPSPLTLKQGYLVVTGVVTAYIFTWVPAWTGWTLLVAMAVYDVAAVLSPVGPLKMLVELADERGEDIPALVYEGRPTGRNPSSRELRERRQQRRRQRRGQHEVLPTEDPDAAGTGSGSASDASDDDAGDDDSAPLLAQAAADTSNHHRRQQQQTLGGSSNEVQAATAQAAAARGGAGTSSGSGAPAGGALDIVTIAGERDLAQGAVGSSSSGDQAQGETRADGGNCGGSSGGSSGRSVGGGRFVVEDAARDVLLGEEEDEAGLPDAIKLGLGDFIFYSVLVGNAAKFDLLTAFVAYVAIIAGLGLTLLLLAVHQKALPALPISIALGCAAYAAARWVLEPVVLGLATRLVFL